MRAIHGYDTPRARNRPSARTPQEIAETPDVEHPLVRTHPETGRKALYLNPNRLDRIVGLERAESDALLDELAGEARKPQHHFGHVWQAGDIVIWDNRATMHRVDVDYPIGEHAPHAARADRGRQAGLKLGRRSGLGRRSSHATHRRPIIASATCQPCCTLRQDLARVLARSSGAWVSFFARAAGEGVGELACAGACLRDGCSSSLKKPTSLRCGSVIRSSIVL